MAEAVCLVTVHGIGFQQPPKDGQPGYADALHEHLRTPLGEHLGDDPERPGEDPNRLGNDPAPPTPPRGPVYVSSEVGGSRTEGLARLDPGRPLVSQPGRIAHVALVYSPSEPLEPRFGETAETLARAAVSHAQYAGALGALRLLLSDAGAALHENSSGDRSTLTPRSDLAAPIHHGLLERVLHRGTQAPAGDPAGASGPAASAPGALGTLQALEDDIATYVTRNDLRERVRGFVQDALLLLIDRGDVSGVVINAHSQGTVLSWDVLCRLPFSAWVRDQDRRAGRFRHFVTAGSPIRKYVDMFAWGDQVGELAAVLGPAGSLDWENFCDPHDPVGDPLNPPAVWRPGDPWTEPPEPDGGLLVARDATGAVRHVSVIDTVVDNIAHSSGGGLQAHDYWNNVDEFVPKLAGLLQP